MLNVENANTVVLRKPTSNCSLKILPVLFVLSMHKNININDININSLKHHLIQIISQWTCNKLLL